MEFKSLQESADRNKALYQYDNPNPSLLERFVNPITVSNLEVVIDIPFFTSLCPITGQPDFASIKITYTPETYCVESKSLKLYLMGYRNYGAFHEQCINLICKDLGILLSPKRLVVQGTFEARGGISFNPIATWEEPEIGIQK